MNSSGFTDPGASSASPEGMRIRLNPPGGRYDCYKVRRHGRLHFEKRVAPRWMADVQTVEALRKEFEIGYSLEHQGIVRYLLYEPPSLYQEYLEGSTLRELIDDRDPRLSEPGFLRGVARQILDALAYIHSQGVLHLDIKPENVMLLSVGSTIKLLDFGCARNSGFDTTEGYTAAYMAPEQGSAQQHTGVSTDIYLVGRTMEELAAAGGLTDTWKDFVAKATAADPSQRYPDAKTAISALPESSGAKNKSGCLIWVIGAIAILMVLTDTGGEIVRFLEECIDNVLPSKQPADEIEFNQAADLIRGKGVPRDEQEGLRLMQRAAENGNDMAQCYLGLTYRDGSSFLPRDLQKSMMWIRKAAEQGNVIAEEEIGLRYYEGLGVERDYTEALKWLKLAASHGKDTAYASVGIMYRDGSGTSVDYAEATRWFKKGAKLGNSYCANLLGQLYAYFIKPVDSDKAIEWWQKASDMGSHRANEQLYRIYTQGDSILKVAPDSILANKYYVRLESSDGR